MDMAEWLHALDAMELHLEEIRAGVASGVMPDPYEVEMPRSPFPARLAARARRLRAAQDDVEALLRDRLGTLGAVMSGAFSPSTPAPLFVDRRE
jgi:hypothetical protein